MYKTDAAGNISGDPVDSTTEIGADGSVSFTASLDSGMNYFRMRATSSYNMTGDSKEEETPKNPADTTQQEAPMMRPQTQKHRR